MHTGVYQAVRTLYSWCFIMYMHICRNPDTHTIFEIIVKSITEMVDYSMWIISVHQCSLPTKLVKTCIREASCEGTNIFLCFLIEMVNFIKNICSCY